VSECLRVCVRVFVTVRLHVSKTTYPNFAKYSIHVVMLRVATALATAQYVMYFRFCGWRHFLHWHAVAQ